MTMEIVRKNGAGMVDIVWVRVQWIQWILFFRYIALSRPESVQNRSVHCDIAWPQYSDISQSERDFPLGENKILSSVFLSDIDM